MNHYLEGNFAPVREEVTLTDLEVTGVIPDYLDGRYVRTGPNPLAEVDPVQHHWFLGDGMVHGIRIRDGKAEWYRNRWVRANHVAELLGENRPPQKTHAGFDMAPNTNVIQHGGRTFAIVEAGSLPYELTDELDTVGACDFDGTLDGGFTAHPHTDPETGELHAVSYYYGWGRKVRYSVLGADGRIRRSVDIPVHGAPMMHDFALTEDYVILYDLPVTFDTRQAVGPAPTPVHSVMSRILGQYPIPAPVLAAVGRGRASSTGMPYRWDPDYPARLGVLPRDGKPGDIRWFEVDPCYVFHGLNAFQDGDEIVLDVVRHPKMFATSQHGPNPLGDGAPALYRWTIDQEAGKVRADEVDDIAQEFPRFDERRTGRAHRYGYAVGFADVGADRPFSSNLVMRHDLQERRTERLELGADRHAGEFVFVPSAPDAAEEDGVLMGYVHDEGTGRSELLMLDAATLGHVATIQLPVRVPYGFHGNWMPAGSSNIAA